MFVRTGSAVGTFAFASLLSYWMPKAEYGAVAVLMTVAVFVGVICSFGQRNLLIREMSRANTPEQAQMLAQRSTLWSLYGGSIGAVLVFSGFYVRGESMFFCICAALLVILLSVNDTWSGSGTVYKKFFWAVGPRDLCWRILVVGLVGATYYLAGEVPLYRQTVALIVLGVFVVLVIVQKIILGPVIAPLSFSGVQPAPHLRRPSLNFLFSSLSGLGFVTLDVAVIGFMLGDIAAAEYYPANRLALFALFFYMALATVISPELSRKYKNNDLDGLRYYASLGVIGASIPALAFLALIIFGREYIYVLFETATDVTLICTFILTVGQVFCCIIGYSAQCLMMSGHEAKVARITMGCFICAGFFVPFATKSYGIIGTAICMTSFTIVREIVLWNCCKRTLGISVDLSNALVFLSRRK